MLFARSSGFVILGVLINCPDIVATVARDNVFCGEHGRHHGMVLIVVLVHAVAAYQMQARKLLFERRADRVYVPLITVVINGISFALTDYTAINNVGSVGEIQVLNLLLCQLQ